MQNNKVSRSGSNPDHEPFTTIDDLLQKSRELLAGLERLSELRHPLAVRRGVRKGVTKNMTDSKQSRQIKGSGRTYFLDVQEIKGGQLSSDN